MKKKENRKWMRMTSFVLSACMFFSLPGVTGYGETVSDSGNAGTAVSAAEEAGGTEDSAAVSDAGRESDLLNELEVLEKSVDPDDYDGYIFKLNDGVSKTRMIAFSDDSSIESISYTEDLYTADSAEDIFESFSADEIEYVEPNYIVELFDTDTMSATDPDDTYYQNGYQWNLDVLNVEAVWEYGLEGQSVCDEDDVVVAVIDSGVNADHEDIDASHILDGYSYVTSDTSNTGDTLGHGTFCTGQIMATKDNEVGIAGIAPEVYVMPLRVFGSSGSGYTSDIVSAINYATESGCVDVISMSLGGESSSTSMKTACESAVAAGILVVAAAGNDGDTTLNYPAAYDCVVGVGSVGTDDSNTEVSDFSQRGTTNVFCTAPGYRIVSTYYDSSDSYYRGSGTSFATPEVAALAAILKSIDRSITQEEFMSVLIDTSTDLGDEGRDSSYGYGLINFQTAAEYLLGDQTGTAVLSFNVVNEDGETVSDAAISVYEYESGEQVYPDEDGTYTLEHGRYSYTVSAEKYETATGVFSLVGSARTLTITLEGLSYPVNITAKNTSDEALSDTMITVKNSKGTTASQEEDGSFLLKTGNYTYSVSCTGYYTQTGSFTVEEGGTSLEVVLYGDMDVASTSFRIVNEDGTDLTGVTLSVYNEAGGKVEVYEDGYYKFQPGTYTYTAESPVYMTETGSFEITEDQKNTVIELTVVMSNPILWVYFEVVPIYADVTVTDSSGEVVEPYSAGEYKLSKGTYQYTITAEGYETVEDEFTLTTSGRTIEIDMESSNEDGTVSVVFISNGGSAVEAQSVALGEKAAEPETPTREGYVFDGWYKDASLTTPWDFDVDVVTQRTVLYAGWSPASWQVNYLFGDTVLEGLTPSVHTYGVSERELPEPVIEGWHFMYWCADAELTERVEYISASAIGEITLYAYCQEDTGEYTVDFESNGGSEVASQTLTSDTGYLAAEPEDPVREGYVFSGWYADAELQDAWDFGADAVTWHTTLYAAWTPAVYSITYISDGEVLTGLTPDCYTYLQTVSGLPEPDSSDDRVFAGWYSDEEFTVRVRSIPAGQTGDVTLYARWSDPQDAVPDDCDYEPDEDGNYPEVDADGYTLIYTQEQLEALSEYIYTSAEARSLKSAGTIPKFRLAQSILLTGDWSPIAVSGYFVGEFDGAGHTIAGLNVNYSGSYASLFGNAYYATFSNLKLYGTVNGGSHSAALVGDCYQCEFLNVETDVTVTGSGTNTGGIVSCLMGGSIINCANYGDVTCTGTISGSTCIYAVGGILGGTEFSSSAIQVEGCVNYGEVTNASGTPTGGIVGYIQNSSSTVSNCYNRGNVSQTMSGSVAVYGTASGIVGLFKTAGTISSCYNTGTITSSETSSNGYTLVAEDAFYNTSSANASACWYLENTAYPDEETAAPAIGRIATDSDISGYVWYYISYFTDETCGGSFAWSETADYSSLIDALGDEFTGDTDGTVNNGFPALKWQTQSEFLVDFLLTDAITGDDVTDAVLTVDGEETEGFSVYLTPGIHSYTITKSGYQAISSVISVNRMDMDYPVEMEPVYYTYTFTVEPADAEFTLDNSVFGTLEPDSAEENGSGGMVYTFSLARSTLYGNYSYEVSKYGYGTSSGEVSVTQRGAMSITLYESEYYTLNFELYPETASVTVWNEKGSIVEPYEGSLYHLTEGTYTYTVKADGYYSTSGTVTAGGTTNITIVLTAYNGWNGTSDTDWYDDDEDTFYIGTAEELAGFRDLCNAGNTFDGKTIILTDDIELNDISWTPIGVYNYSGTTDFSGTFDGAGYTIAGLNVDSTSTRVGLFASVYGAEIKNLTVEGSVTGKQMVGGIAGYVRGSTFENCVNKADVTATTYHAGGVVGAAASSASTFTRCVNLGTVTATSSTYTSTNSYAVGGVVGEVSSSSCSFEYCINRGTVSACIKSVGGVVGYIGSASSSITPSVKYCYNEGTVENTYASGYTGGVIGRVYSSYTKATVTGCLNLGALIADEENGCVGGIIGYDSGATDTVTNCWYSYDTASRGIGDQEDEDGAANVFGSEEDPGYAAVVEELGENYTLSGSTGRPILRWEDEDSLYLVTFTVNYDTEDNLSDENALSFVVTKESSGGELGEIYAVTNGTVLLPSGTYQYGISRIGYEEEKGSFTVNAQNQEISVMMTAVRYEFSLSYSPENAEVSLLDAQGSPVEASSSADGTAEFALTNGTYTYTVSAYGYETAEGTVTIAYADASAQADLEALSEYETQFEVTPADGAFTDTPTVHIYQDGTRIASVSSGDSAVLAAGSYTYVARAEGYQTQTGDFTVDGEGTVEITMQPREAGSTEADTYWYYDDPSQSEFTIRTADELFGLAELVNNGEESFEGKTVTLAADISMSDVSWTPIGSWSGYTFSGTFDGDGHSITFKNGVIGGTEIGFGLFGYLDGAEVTDLILRGNLAISDSSSSTDAVVVYVGGLAGYATDTVISRVSNQMAVSVDALIGNSGVLDVGGLIGWAYGVTLESCNNLGSVSASVESLSGGIAITYTGGLIGYGISSGSSPVIIRNCYNTGNIRAVSSYMAQAAGILGVVNSSDGVLQIRNCYNTGAVTATADSSTAAALCSSTSLSGTVSNNYYLSGSAESAFGTEKTEEEFVSSELAESLGSAYVYAEGKTPILVWERSVESIEVSALPDKTEYEDMEDFDDAGMTLLVTYSDGSSEIIESGWTVLDGSDLRVDREGIETKSSAEVFVTVSFQGKTAQVPVTVTQVVHTISDEDLVFDIPAPTAGEAAEPMVFETDQYTATVIWTKNGETFTGIFEENTYYRALVEVQAKYVTGEVWYAFTTESSVSAEGILEQLNKSVRGIAADDGNYTYMSVSLTYASTGSHDGTVSEPSLHLYYEGDSSETADYTELLETELTISDGTDTVIYTLRELEQMALDGKGIEADYSTYDGTTRSVVKLTGISLYGLCKDSGLFDDSLSDDTTVIIGDDSYTWGQVRASGGCYGTDGTLTAFGLPFLLVFAVNGTPCTSDGPMRAIRPMTSASDETSFTDQVTSVSLGDVSHVTQHQVTFLVTAEDGADLDELLTITVWDSQGNVMRAVSDGVYSLNEGEDYTYAVAAAGYGTQKGGISSPGGDTSISLTLRRIWDGTTLTEPELSEDGYYLIYTAEELMWFNRNAENDTNARLMADITLNSDGEYENTWTPMFTSETGTGYYTGTFDGNGHTISNLYMYVENQYVIELSGDGSPLLTSTRTDVVGLFGYVSGTVTDLAVTGKIEILDRPSSSYADWFMLGGIAGYLAGGGLISGCSTDMELIYNVGQETTTTAGYPDCGYPEVCDTYIGGIAGSVSSGTVENCYSTGSISGAGTRTIRAGGIVGGLRYTDALVQYCYSVSNITAEPGETYTGSMESAIGSIVGHAAVVNGGTVQYCFGLSETLDGVNSLRVSANRVVGAGGESATLAYNYGNEAMNIVNVTTHDEANFSRSSVNGASIDMIRATKSLSPYTAVGWSEQIWKSDSADTLPTFVWQISRAEVATYPISFDLDDGVSVNFTGGVESSDGSMTASASSDTTFTTTSLSTVTFTVDGGDGVVSEVTCTGGSMSTAGGYYSVSGITGELIITVRLESDSE